MSVAVEATKSAFDFIWRIENFNYALQDIGESIESPSFKMPNSIHAYFLQLFPRGTGSSKEANLVCNLCHGAEKEKSRFIYKISIYVADEDFANQLQSEDVSLNRHSWIPLDEIRFFDLEQKSLLPHGTLTIGFKLLKHKVILPPNTYLACTRIEIQSSSFIWRIKEFSNFLHPPQKVHNVKFPSRYSELNMTIKIFWGSINREENIQFEIKQVGVSTRNRVLCKVSLLNAKGKAQRSMRLEHRFDVCTGEHIWSLPFFISKRSLTDDKAQVLPNDVLSLGFEFVTSVGITSNQFEEEDTVYLPPETHYFVDEVNTTNSDKTTPNNLKKDLLFVYQHKKFCDLTLQAGNSEFPVHKSILCARSPVFFAMFERDMVENQTGIVDIPDLDADTVQHMILYMYTDTVPELHLDSASKLYFAADKYRILPLREVCSTFMISQLDSSNVLLVLVLADRHRDGSLKLACQKFISDSGQEIVTSDEWKTFEKDNLELAVDSLRFLYLQKF